jgi:transposase
MVCEACRPEFEKLLVRLEQLEKRLRAYENAHTPSSKSLKKRPREPPVGKLGAPTGHPKYERKEPEPTGSIEYREKTCPMCNCELCSPVRMVRVLEEEIPEPRAIEVIEHKINHYICPDCHEYIVARNNAPVGRFGKNALTHITLLKFEDRLPLRKVVNSLQRHYGLTLTNVGVMKVTERVAERLSESYEKLITSIRKSKVIYVDETQMKINGLTFWIWVFVTPTQTLFVIRKSRSATTIVEILGENFRGIISCDGWNAYTQYSSNLQRCWAHLLRESKNLKEKFSNFSGFHDSFTAMFERISQIRKKPPSLEKRQGFVTDLKLEMAQVISQMEAYKELKTFTTKVRNGMEYWFTCITNLFVEPTNNIAERALRELVVLRKIIGGLRREKGARVLETISSVIATSKQQGLSTFGTIKSQL